MLTLMCPNCKFRFPTEVSDCCNENKHKNSIIVEQSLPNLKIYHEQQQQQQQQQEPKEKENSLIISTKCGFQSGGSLIIEKNINTDNSDSDKQLLRLEVKSKLIEIDNDDNNKIKCKLEQDKDDKISHMVQLNNINCDCNNYLPKCYCHCRCCYSYCKKNQDNSNCQNNSNQRSLCHVASTDQHSNCRLKHDKIHSCQNLNTTKIKENESTKNLDDLQIQVNATVVIPSKSTGECTVNITATTQTSSKNKKSSITSSTSSTSSSSSLSSDIITRTRDNFNGGGIVSADLQVNSNNVPYTTPWMFMSPCPYAFKDGYLIDQELSHLNDVRRMLQTCGWYHENLSWQQSENLLKNAPVGRWLLRDSSDSRYVFAISVQTARGPTSVRVHYFNGKFCLDAEPRLISQMPLFDSPVKLIEYYVDYSKRMDVQRREVWVDYSGQLYSQIYLSEPLVKEIRSLSHLARIVVNKNNLKTNNLPPLIKNYLDDYPYTL